MTQEKRTETDRRGIAPPTFTDTLGRRWTIALDFEVYRRVLTNHDVDLCDIVYEEQKSLKALDNAMTLVDVLYEIVKVEAIGRGVDEIAFAKALDMPVVVEAQRRLVDEMLFFSRSHLRAAIVREAVAACDKAEREAREEVERELPRIRKAMETMGPFAPGDLDGSSPGSSESTPGNGPSGNSHGPQRNGSATNGTTPPASSPRPPRRTEIRSGVQRRSPRKTSTHLSKRRKK